MSKQILFNGDTAETMRWTIRVNKFVETYYHNIEPDKVAALASKVSTETPGIRVDIVCVNLVRRTYLDGELLVNNVVFSKVVPGRNLSALSVSKWCNM